MSFVEQRVTINRAVNIIGSLPPDAAWALAITDEDGQGKDPTRASLAIAFKGAWQVDDFIEDYEDVELFEVEGEKWYVMVDGWLEITVEALA